MFYTFHFLFLSFCYIKINFFKPLFKSWSLISSNPKNLRRDVNRTFLKELWRFASECLDISCHCDEVLGKSICFQVGCTAEYFIWLSGTKFALPCSHPISKIHFNIILPSMPSISNSFFLQDF
jgi:hypothetical protein